MPDDKYLWRATLRQVSRPLYVVARDMATAQAVVSKGARLTPQDVTCMERLCVWDDQDQMTSGWWPPTKPPYKLPE